MTKLLFIVFDLIALDQYPFVCTARSNSMHTHQQFEHSFLTNLARSRQQVRCHVSQFFGQADLLCDVKEQGGSLNQLFHKDDK